MCGLLHAACMYSMYGPELLQDCRACSVLTTLWLRACVLCCGAGSSSSGSSDGSLVREEVAQVEMLLEAYFMHIDNVYNRLTVGRDGCSIGCVVAMQMRFVLSEMGWDAGR